MGISNNDRDDVFVKGDDGTNDGAVFEAVTRSDNKKALAVDAILSAVGGSIGVPSFCADNLTYDDMNVSNGGVARDTNIGTTFTDVYNVSGAGLLLGFKINLEDIGDEWWIRLIVDSNEIFLDSDGISTGDIVRSNIYDYEDDDKFAFRELGIRQTDRTFSWEAPYGALKYASNITIKVRYKNNSNRFRAGLVMRTK